VVLSRNFKVISSPIFLQSSPLGQEPHDTAAYDDEGDDDREQPANTALVLLSAPTMLQ
jgi:hypothetical protein